MWDGTRLPRRVQRIVKPRNYQLLRGVLILHYSPRGRLHPQKSDVSFVLVPNLVRVTRCSFWLSGDHRHVGTGEANVHIFDSIRDA